MIHQTATTDLLITLEVGRRTVLYLMFYEDGTTIRQGNGGTDCKDTYQYIGKLDPGLFQELKSSIHPKMSDHFEKKYNEKVKRGAICKLMIMSRTDGVLKGLEFVHGELSSSLPVEVMDFVVKAVQLTESWYIEQRNMRLAMRPWWKFW